MAFGIVARLFSVDRMKNRDQQIAIKNQERGKYLRETAEKTITTGNTNRSDSRTSSLYGERSRLMLQRCITILKMALSSQLTGCLLINTFLTRCHALTG